MLIGFSFKNYKAFSQGSIRLRPITILMGANSTGKTSILHVPLIFQQTALLAGAKYKSALRLHGRIVSLGDNDSLLKNRDLDNPITLCMTFKAHTLLEDLRKRLPEILITSVVDSYATTAHLLSYVRKKNLSSNCLPEHMELDELPTNLNDLNINDIIKIVERNSELSQLVLK